MSVEANRWTVAGWLAGLGRKQTQPKVRNRPGTEFNHTVLYALSFSRSMNPIKFLLIDGKPEMLQRFVVPEMSLSSCRATMVPQSFALGINAALLDELLAPSYVALVDELRGNDECLGKAQDALARPGYPKFDEVLKVPELTELVLGTIFYTNGSDALRRKRLDSKSTGLAKSAVARSQAIR
jgi:hypothetical protein